MEADMLIPRQLQWVTPCSVVEHRVETIFL